MVKKTLMLFVFAMGLSAGLSAKTYAFVPVAITTCATCGSQADLQAAALAYFKEWSGLEPSGYADVIGGPKYQCVTLGTNSSPPAVAESTTLLVISTKIAISGTFYPCNDVIYRTGNRLAVAPLSAQTDAQAVSADNILLRRAAASAGKVTLPKSLPLTGGSDPIEVTEEWLSDTGLPQVGATTYSLWHGILTLNMSAVAQATFLNTTTGKPFTVWSGDVVTVTDALGNTAQFQYNPEAPTKWVYVPNSIRDPNGKPIPGSASNNLLPGGSQQPIGPINVALPGAAPVYISPWFDNATLGGTVTVGEPIASPSPAVECTDTATCGG